MGSVHQGPGNRKGNEIRIAKADLVRALRRVVLAEAGPQASFDQIEIATMAATNEASRVYFEQILQQISDSYCDEMIIDDVLHRRSHEPAKGRYHSLCGTLVVTRATYRRVGERNGPTIVPLDLEAGLVERATPALGYSIALGYAKGTSRDYVEDMEGAQRQVPSRSTVERIGKAIGERAKGAAPRIEAYLRRSEGVPETTAAVSLGLDRTSVPFEEERSEGEEPKTRRKKRKKPYERTPPPEVDVNFHMAYVGTVSFVDDDGESLATRKYAATHHEGPEGVVDRMMKDLRSAKLTEPSLLVGVAQDGAPEMWNLMRRGLEAVPIVTHWEEVIDRYHLCERLGKVLRVTEPAPERRKELLAQWQHELDSDDGSIDRIRQYIDERAWLYAGDDRSTLLDNITFIDNNNDRMRYVGSRESGLPIGSGATEGACKSLIAVRAKRSGQRWHDEGISAVLTLRAIHQSDRLPRFWAHLRRRSMARVEDAMEAAA